MSIAIKFGDDTQQSSLSGAIYLDATTDFGRDYSGKVTEHPIEAGASVTDHFISANPKVRISGVISHVDFSSYPKTMVVDGYSVINANQQPSPVIVNDIGSGLSKLLPGVVTQFLPIVSPNVILDSTGRVNYRDFIEILLREIITGLFYNEQRKKWENKMTTSSLFVVERGVPMPFMKDMILTSFSVKEDADSGDDLFCELSFEQVKFVTLEKAEAPKPAPKTADARATETPVNRGNAETTPINGNTTEQATVKGKVENVIRGAPQSNDNFEVPGT